MSLSDAPPLKLVSTSPTSSPWPREPAEVEEDLYVGVLGGKVVKAENPCYIQLANSWIILNSGGGPTPDKPEVILKTPEDLNTVSSFPEPARGGCVELLSRTERQGRAVLTEPMDNHGWELRC